MSTSTTTSGPWIKRAADLVIENRLFIGGQFVEGSEGFDRISPRDGTVLASVSAAGEADVDRAVAAARTAFDTGPWPRMKPRERARILQRWADLIERDRATLALLVSLEMGKPIRDSYGVDAPAVVRTIRWYAELADKESGEIPDVGVDALALVTRQASGVVGAVVPWNFPITMAAWKLAPALVVGCTAVLKPAEQSPLSALHLATLAAQAGLPEGVLNVVNGVGSVAGRALGLHPGVDVLAFTGSTEVGRHFMRYSADSNLKRVWLELGGKSPNIVFPDAPDLDAAATAAAWAIFSNGGQMCTAGSRLLVHEAIAEEFTDLVVAKAAKWIPGDPLEPATTMGPLVNRDHRASVIAHIDRGIADGARLRIGGGIVHEAGTATPFDDGAYLQPTVLDHVDRASALAQQEIFGPVLGVLTFRDADDAVAAASDTDYGLAAAIWTADLTTAHRVSAAIPAGTVWVNCYEEGDMTVPFGGMKLSGHGRDKSRHALEKYTDLKTTWISLD